MWFNVKEDSGIGEQCKGRIISFLSRIIGSSIKDETCGFRMWQESVV